MKHNRFLQSEEYKEDIRQCALNNRIPWNLLRNKTVLVSGATGMIASVLIDILMYRNKHCWDNIKIIAVSRSAQRAERRFGEYMVDKAHFCHISHDITEPLDITQQADYVIHAASNTHPVAYATDPIGTITANVDGTRYLLDLSVKCGCRRFVFLSSVEIYGENRGDVDKFDEKYLGYLDCNTLRAGYPESKRLGETLCHAYGKKYGIDFVIPRLSRVYGPTVMESDTKAISQFIHKAVQKEDIVLKSDGSQLYSYTYVTDAVMGILTILLLGKSKCAYNIADSHSDIMLRDLAEILAEISNKKVIFDLPDDIEAAGYSKATKALLDSSALEELGWKAKVHIREGLQKTIGLLSL